MWLEKSEIQRVRRQSAKERAFQEDIDDQSLHSHPRP